MVLGGINMDLIGVAARLPSPGETVIGERFFTTPGGKGANQAVAAARLGSNVKMVGRVGADSYGASLIQGLREHRVDVAGVAVDPSNATGIAIILLDSQGQNHIVAIYGANTACDDAQLSAAKTALEFADVLLLQQEVPLEVSLAAARYARSHAIRVIWDPAPAMDLPKETYSVVDVLTPNQTEATFLTGVNVDGPDSARDAAEVLLSRGVPAAVVKLGEKGVYCASAADSAYVPPFGVDVVDTVGAGDAFGAALAVALCEGRGLGDSVRYGAAAGALAVTTPGAQEAMPSRNEVEALFSGP